MKRYAIKVIKGKEFLQSKNDMIDLGSKSLEIHNKVIKILNDKNPLKNLNIKECYFIVDFDKLAFSGKDHAIYKVIYGKNNIKLKYL